MILQQFYELFIFCIFVNANMILISFRFLNYNKGACKINSLELFVDAKYDAIPVPIEYPTTII